MTFSFSARHRFDAFEIDASFSMEGGVTALFGRSGSGKSSILKMIAGLMEPQQGKITIDGDTLFDKAQRRSVSPHKRRFGYVFQEPRLFPHLSVLQNLRYATWFHRQSLPQSEFDKIVAMLGIGALLTRHPHSLSGGEQQRVAIGRALMSAPRLLLMDEPLASLDQGRKAEILPFLEDLCANTQLPIIYVSHSLNEVMRLADQVVLLDGGRVTSIQAPDTLTQNPAFVSALGRSEIGSLIEGHVTFFDDAEKLIRLSIAGDILTVPANHGTVGETLKIFIAARDVMLATQKPEGISALNIIDAKISAITSPQPGIANISLRCGGTQLLAQITSVSAQRLGLEVDMPVYAIIKAVTFDQD